MYYVMVVKKSANSRILFERQFKAEEVWDYIEDATFSISIGSHVCMTCSKFGFLYSNTCASKLCCKFHKKLIWQGQHLTHSCDLYVMKSNL